MEERVLELLHEKRRFLIPALMAVFIFYFLLPLSLIFIPDVMKQTSFIPGVTWAWAFAFLQFPMTWLVSWLYHIKAKKFDQQIEALRREELT